MDLLRAAIAGLHILYSQTGWLYRYEAYLVALSICAAAVGLENLSRSRSTLRSVMTESGWRWLSIAVVFLAVLALADGARIEVIGLIGTKEIYSQQGSMARFAASACPRCRVVVNDIGMVSLYGDNEVADSYGLSDLPVLEAKLDDDYTPERLDEIARSEGAQWAMVYDAPAWTPVPDSWVHVGDWTWHGMHVVGGSTVSVFVIDPAVEPRIRAAFAHFRPPGAQVSRG